MDSSDRRPCTTDLALSDKSNVVLTSRGAYLLDVGQLLSTEGIDPRDRTAYWREVVCRTFIQLEVTQAAPHRFRGMVETEHAGPVQVTRIRTDPMTAVRTRAHLHAAEEELCLVAVQLEGRTVGRQDGRTASLSGGELALFDSTRPYGVDFQGPKFDHLVVQFPRHLLADRGVAIEHATARTVSNRSTLGRIAFPFIISIARSAGTMAPETRQQLGEMLLDVLARALHSPGAASSLPRARERILESVKLYAHAHLSDPNLESSQGCRSGQRFAPPASSSFRHRRNDLLPLGTQRTTPPLL